MTDHETAESLLRLGEELLIKGDPENAFLCTTAAARLMLIPSAAETLRHPSRGADAITREMDGALVSLFGLRNKELD